MRPWPVTVHTAYGYGSFITWPIVPGLTRLTVCPMCLRTSIVIHARQRIPLGPWCTTFVWKMMEPDLNPQAPQTEQTFIEHEACSLQADTTASNSQTSVSSQCHRLRDCVNRISALSEHERRTQPGCRAAAACSAEARCVYDAYI